MVASDVSDVPNGRNQLLGVDVTGPWRFVSLKDGFDCGMLVMLVPNCEYWNFISPLSTDLPTLNRLINTLPHRRIGSISMTLFEWAFLTQWPAVVLFSSATYLFTSYNHRAVRLLPNSSQIFSLDYST